ncbi:Phytoene synthase, chloroplastic [Vitis vinifera]|uniref:Phytoene synthase, chloroplastic n=1 Tax=Vitis vinifera TaxID=29760 RepID=A0A438ELM5_VITVI|nr:Phytoene synthase, chloroplastic [Vitis vinifera]
MYARFGYACNEIFSDYAKPLRLLPTAEVQDYTGASLEKIPSLFRKDESKSLYKVKIQTSSIYGSGLGDINAGVLLANRRKWSVEIGGVSLTIICSCESPTEDTDEKESQYSGFHYDFDVEDILLGEGTSLASQGISNEESMREYADLKFSLLLYDTMLTLVGTQIASLSAGEKAGFAFLTVAVRLAVSVVTTNSGDIPLALTPRELVVGMMGFLVCKVAVCWQHLNPCNRPEGEQVIHFLLFPMLYEGELKKTELQLPTMLFLDRYVADKSASLQDPLYLYTKVEPAKIYQMSSAFSLAVKPSVAWSNGKLLSRKSTRRAARAEVIVAPKKRTSTHNVPELSKQAFLILIYMYEKLSRGNLLTKYAKTFYLGYNFTSLLSMMPDLFFQTFTKNSVNDRGATESYMAIYGEESLLELKDVFTFERLTCSSLVSEMFSTVWCRRTDELVDGPNAAYMSSAVLDRWEERLHDIFNGRPYDMLDAALTDTITTLQGHDRGHENGYPKFSLCKFSRALPLLLLCGWNRRPNECPSNGNCTRDIFSRKVNDGWREFMKQQITRARFYFNQAEEGASQLDKASRWPVWSSLLLYRKILDAIEENDYDNLTKRHTWEDKEASHAAISIL